MKLRKIIFGIVGLGIIFLGFYIFELHWLATKNNAIFSIRCSYVNPPLIAYKNSFLNFAEAANNPDSFTPEETALYYIDYIKGMQEYAPKEAEWLKIDADYMNSWNFKLFEPWYIKKAAEYQYKMYQGYGGEAQATVDVIDGKISREEYQKRFSEARDLRNENSKLYFDFFEQASKIFDIRKVFGRVPVPEVCNDSNLIIPDTTGAFEPTPTPAPNANYKNSG